MIPAYATPINDRFGIGLGYHGPAVIPCYAFGDSTREVWPNQPGHYGRYITVDMTVNNRAAVDQWCERNPDKPRPDLGFAVCRHGFGLQRHDGYMTEQEAEAMAKALNDASPIGYEVETAGLG